MGSPGAHFGSKLGSTNGLIIVVLCFMHLYALVAKRTNTYLVDFSEFPFPPILASYVALLRNDPGFWGLHPGLGDKVGQGILQFQQP